MDTFLGEENNEIIEMLEKKMLDKKVENNAEKKMIVHYNLCKNFVFDEEYDDEGSKIF